jgi:hypothetical protein
VFITHKRYVSLLIKGFYGILKGFRGVKYRIFVKGTGKMGRNILHLKAKE